MPTVKIFVQDKNDLNNNTSYMFNFEIYFWQSKFTTELKLFTSVAIFFDRKNASTVLQTDTDLFE